MKKKEKENLQDIILVQMYEIVKIQIHFQSNYLIILLKCFYGCVNLRKIFKKDFFFFIWTKYGKDNNGQSWVLLYVTKDDVR
jgi:hypothetical protein